MDADTLALARRVYAATMPTSELGQLARRIILEDHDARMDGRQAATALPKPLACYFCDRLATTIEAGYATCEPMFHDSQRRRLEDWRSVLGFAARPTDGDGYEATHWTADELHRHVGAGVTWEHAHEGGHEAHSAVSHDLSGAVEVTPGRYWCSYCGQRDTTHKGGYTCAGGHWSGDEEAARRTRYALGGEPAAMGGDA